MKVGDVVMLKSGGPHMTVDEVFADGKSCRCFWFQATPAMVGDKVGMLYQPQLWKDVFQCESLAAPGGSRIVTPV